jgi:hypothetical protein
MTDARPLAVLVLAAALAPGCGHKGPPVAPQRRTPPMLGEFRLAQRGDVLEVSCTAPRASVDGVAFDSVDVEFFWGEGQVDLEEEGQRRTVRAAPGERIVVTLPLPDPGTLVRAAARAAAGRSRGQRTLILALEAQAPLVPPRDLGAWLRERGVVLSWKGPVEPPELGPSGGAPVPFSDFFSREPPEPDAGLRSEPQGSEPESPVLPGVIAVPGEEEGAVPAEEEGAVPGEEEGAVSAEEEGAVPAEPLRTHGFLVYRRTRSGAYSVPLSPEPQEGRELTDRGAQVGTTVCYVIRAAGSVQPLIESAPSNEVCLAVRDITPPAPPTGLAVVPRDGGLDVVWSPSPAPDLEGYRVYRAQAEEAGEVVAEVEPGETAWHDASVEGGILYRYEITAVDRAGNEGPRSGSAEGRPE